MKRFFSIFILFIISNHAISGQIFTYKDSEESNMTLVDGDPVGYGPIKNEYGEIQEIIKFNDIKVELDTKNSSCFFVFNRSPRNFDSLKVGIGSSYALTDNVMAFTTYRYCSDSEISTPLNLDFNQLPNNNFNATLNGFWSDKSPDYSYFTKERKNQQIRAFLDLKFVLNTESFKDYLVDEFNGDKARADSTRKKLENTSKYLRPFVLDCCSEGRASRDGDWFSIHSWRYNREPGEKDTSLLVEVLAHEITHNLGYYEGDAYPVGYAAEKVIKEAYSTGSLVKNKPWIEKTIVEEKNDTLKLDALSKNYSVDTPSSDSSVYFYVPMQRDVISTDAQRNNGRDLWSGVEGKSEIVALVTGSDGKKYNLNLIAQKRLIGMKWLKMHDGVKRGNGELKVYINKNNENFMSLPPQSYTGKIYIVAQGWHDQEFQKTIELNLSFIK